MRRSAALCLFLLLSVTLVLLGCVEEEKVQPQKIEQFTPPEDGKITPSQAEAYVKASLALVRALKKHEKVIRKFTKKHELKDDLSQVGDTAFMREHPEVAKDWDDIQEKWREYEKGAYTQAGMSEEEFNWIGGALTDTLNRDIQKRVAEMLSPDTE